MNKRINELWLETYKPYSNFDYEKFAELIVQECIGIADEYDGAGSTIVDRIKKHFGVNDEVVKS